MNHLYIRYGVVLRKLDLIKEAIDVFVEATHSLPLHWGAWLELCNLITDKEMVSLSALLCVVILSLKIKRFYKKGNLVYKNASFSLGVGFNDK